MLQNLEWFLLWTFFLLFSSKSRSTCFQPTLLLTSLYWKEQRVFLLNQISLCETLWLNKTGLRPRTSIVTAEAFFFQVQLSSKIAKCHHSRWCELVPNTKYSEIHLTLFFQKTFILEKAKGYGAVLPAHPEHLHHHPTEQHDIHISTPPLEMSCCWVWKWAMYNCIWHS